MTRVLVAIALIITVAAPANAYVRSRTGSGTPVAFDSACIIIQPDSAGSEDVAISDVISVVQKCMSNWSVAMQCSYMQLMYKDAVPMDATYDGINTVKFRDQSWCHPATKNSPERCYEPAAAAITTVFYLDRLHQPHDGTIVDADIEVNEVNFTFTLLPSDKVARTGTSLADLENTVTHEMGHVMGLDHTCADSSTAANAVDENGVRPPDCSGLAAVPEPERDTITEATMFNSAGPGETKKRSPEADDIAGVCAAYPTSSSQPTRCAPVDLGKYTKGCSATNEPLTNPVGALLSLMLFLSAIALGRRQGQSQGQRLLARR